MKNIKYFAITLNVLLIVMFATYFYAHGLPSNWILWSSASLWLITLITNLIFIKKATFFP